MILRSGILSLTSKQIFFEEEEEDMKLGFSSVYKMFVTEAEELTFNILDACREKVGSSNSGNPVTRGSSRSLCLVH